MKHTKNTNESKNQSSNTSRVLSNDLNNPDLFNENKQGEYNYSQDEHGKNAFGSLELKTGTRDSKAQANAGGADRTYRDDGGHLIATRFNGDSGEHNLEAQDRNLNRGAYKHMENEWANSLADGDKVFVNIESYHSNKSERPDAFMGYQVIEHPDGKREWEAFSFQNEDPEERDAQLALMAEFDDPNEQFYNAMDYPADYNPADYENITPSKSHTKNPSETNSQPISENKSENRPEEKKAPENQQPESVTQQTPESQPQGSASQQTPEDQQQESSAQETPGSASQQPSEEKSNDNGQNTNQSPDNNYDYDYGYGY